jgi:hypothetical protein
MVEAAGLEPRSDLQHNHAETRQNPAKSGQSSALEKSPDTVDQQNPALSQHIYARKVCTERVKES